jgi:hypothetical protein
MLTLPVLERVKVGAKIPKLTVVVADRLPEAPVIVRVLVPMLAELLAVSVSMLYPVVGFGVKEAVTPLGSPDVTARFTLPANPSSP